jgi:hypothetical protein
MDVGKPIGLKMYSVLSRSKRCNEIPGSIKSEAYLFQVGGYLTLYSLFNLCLSIALYISLYTGEKLEKFI